MNFRIGQRRALLGSVVAAVAVAAGAFFAAGPLTSAEAATCTVSDKLVNSCRPWLGARAIGYDETGKPDDVANQLAFHEQRIGKQVDLVHDYNGVGENQVTAVDKQFYNRANTYLYLNWKPAGKWAEAAGSNATINAGIDTMANSIKALGTKKLFLTIYHEPENDVSVGSCAPNATDADSGSPADYKAMWHNVRARFDAAGVTNVVWAMTYMGYPAYNCLLKPLWPGNKYVDWVMFDDYASGAQNYVNKLQTLFTLLGTLTDTSHNFTGKPWGLAEYGAHEMPQASAYKMYDDLRAAVAANRWPNVKAWMVFDSPRGPHGGGAVSLDDAKNPDPTETEHYKAFANDPIFSRTTPLK